MRKLLRLGLVAMGVSAAATRADAQCPYCDLPHANCLGADYDTGFTLCEQLPWGCRLTPGQCEPQFALNAPDVTPDGSVRPGLVVNVRLAASVADPARTRPFRQAVVTCQNFILMRNYEAREAATRRQRTIMIAI